MTEYILRLQIEAVGEGANWFENLSPIQWGPLLTGDNLDDVIRMGEAIRKGVLRVQATPDDS